MLCIDTLSELVFCWGFPSHRMVVVDSRFSVSKWWLKKCHAKPWEPFIPGARTLTHWGRVMHICVVKLTIIGSDNGLSSGRCRLKKSSAKWLPFCLSLKVLSSYCSWVWCATPYISLIQIQIEKSIIASNLHQQLTVTSHTLYHKVNKSTQYHIVDIIQIW